MGWPCRRVDLMTRCAITTLTGFRTGLHQCWTSWPDAAFELTDTVLCMPSPVASVPALSLEPAFRRSHGSLYKALARGAVDDEAMRELLVERPQHLGIPCRQRA